MMNQIATHLVLLLLVVVVLVGDIFKKKLGIRFLIGSG